MILLLNIPFPIFHKFQLRKLVNVRLMLWVKQRLYSICMNLSEWLIWFDLLFKEGYNERCILCISIYSVVTSIFKFFKKSFNITDACRYMDHFSLPILNIGIIFAIFQMYLAICINKVLATGLISSFSNCFTLLGQRLFSLADYFL